MRAARRALLLSALERRSNHTAAAAVPEQDGTPSSATSGTTTTSSTAEMDYGALPVLPSFQADLFPQGKFLSIKSRTPDAYLEVRRDLRSHSRSLETQIKQLLQASSSSSTTPDGTLSSSSPAAGESEAERVELALDAYTPLSTKAAEELLAIDAKARRVEALQGFVLSHAEVYQLFHTHVQCGSFDTAVHEWLLRRILDDSRGPPYPLSVCTDVATLLCLQCLPRLPDTSRSGVLWLSRLESAAVALHEAQQATGDNHVQGHTALNSGDVDHDNEATALADLLCRPSFSSSSTSSSSSVVPLAMTRVGDALFVPYMQLVQTSLTAAVARAGRQQDTQETELAAEEEEGGDVEQEANAAESMLLAALRDIFTRSSSSSSMPAPPPRSLADEPGMNAVRDLLTLHVTSTAASAQLPRGTAGADALVHAQHLLRLVRDGGLVQQTHPYPVHVLATWLLPLWQACSGLNLFLADALPVLNEDAVDGGDEAEAEGDGEPAMSDPAGLWDALIPPPATQAQAVRDVLLAFTPLHTPFTTSTSARSLTVPREGRAASSGARATIPVVAPLDTDAYGRDGESLGLGPLFAITEVFLLLAEAASRLKEVQLLAALQIAFCGAFLQCDAGPVALAVDTWTGVLADDGDTTRLRERVASHLALFARDFLAITAYARQSYTTDRTLWALYDHLSLLTSASAATATTAVPSSPETTTTALALAWMHVEAQQAAMDGALRLGSTVETTLNGCLMEAAISLLPDSTASARAWTSCAAYVASAACNANWFTTTTTRSAEEAEEAEEAATASLILSSVHTREKWRATITCSDKVGAVQGDDDSAAWQAWLARLTASSSSSSRAPEATTQTLNGAVEYLVYHYATRLEAEVARPLRAWTANLLAMEHDGDDAQSRTQTDLTLPFGAESQAWLAAVEAELVDRLDSVFVVLDGASASDSWQPSALASLAVLLSAGVPARAGTEPAAEAVTLRRAALLERVGRLMTSQVQSPSSTVEARSGNAAGVVLLCLARAGLWEEVLPLLQVAVPAATMTSAADPAVPWSTATTLDSVVLAEVFVRAREAGAATVCARLRQLRETVFF